MSRAGEISFPVVHSLQQIQVSCLPLVKNSNAKNETFSLFALSPVSQQAQISIAYCALKKNEDY